MADFKLINGDCIKIMKRIPDKSVDLVFVDPPYGTTNNIWDKPLDLKAMWEGIHRIIKENAAVLVCSQLPFSVDVAGSNRAMLRYEWIFEKQRRTGHLNAKKAPLKAHENVLVFYKKQPTYNPQKTEGHAPVHSYKKRMDSDGSCYGKTATASGGGNTDRYPRTIQQFRFAAKERRWMPTQKPISMAKYFIETYTNPGDTVLDFCMGSGTTGAASLLTNRNFIGIERDALNYINACGRLYAIKQQMEECSK